MIELVHEQASELLGAYALHAMEADERLAVAAHVETCEVCRNEVAAHFEIVSILVGDGEPVPEGLWGRIIGQLEVEPPPLRAVASPITTMASMGAAREKKRGRFTAALATITTAAAMVAAVAGFGIINQTNKLNNLESRVNNGNIQQSALAAGTDPTNRHIVLSSADGKYQLDSVIAASGQGFITGGNIPTVDASRTYQLWAIAGGRAISVGLVGRDAHVVAFTLPEKTTALALTNEVNTGSIQATQAPIVRANVGA